MAVSTKTEPGRLVRTVHLKGLRLDEREFDFNIDIERDKCVYGEPDAVFSPEEWSTLNDLQQ